MHTHMTYQEYQYAHQATCVVILSLSFSLSLIQCLFSPLSCKGRLGKAYVSLCVRFSCSPHLEGRRRLYLQLVFGYRFVLTVAVELHDAHRPRIARLIVWSRVVLIEKRLQLDELWQNQLARAAPVSVAIDNDDLTSRCNHNLRVEIFHSYLMIYPVQTIHT